MVFYLPLPDDIKYLIRRIIRRQQYKEKQNLLNLIYSPIILRPRLVPNDTMVTTTIF
jgi:hypothetical protein